MAFPSRPDDNEPIRQARITESAARADTTNAAERAKTTAKNRSFSDPMGAAELYAPHVNPTQLDRAGGVTGPSIVGSWESMNNPDGSFNPRSSQRPIPPKLQESIYSPHIQGQLDSAAGMTRSPIAGTSQLTPYGTASSTFSNAPQTPAVVTSTGVVHPAASDPVANAQARLALQQSHPEVFQPGTRQNKAFIAYAQQHGEAAAHANIDKIMPSPHAFTDANPALASVLPPVPGQTRPPITPQPPAMTPAPATPAPATQIATQPPTPTATAGHHLTSQSNGFVQNYDAQGNPSGMIARPTPPLKKMQDWFKTQQFVNHPTAANNIFSP